MRCFMISNIITYKTISIMVWLFLYHPFLLISMWRKTAQALFLRDTWLSFKMSRKRISKPSCNHVMEESLALTIWCSWGSERGGAVTLMKCIYLKASFRILLRSYGDKSVSNDEKLFSQMKYFLVWNSFLVLVHLSVHLTIVWVWNESVLNSWFSLSHIWS